MDNKHTQAFAKQVQNNIDREIDFQLKVDFVKCLSEKQHNNAMSAIIRGTGRMRVSTTEVYSYCIKNNIKPANPNGHFRIKDELAQQEIDFSPQKTDYSKFSSGDEIKHNSKDGFVLDNDLDKKELYIEYSDGEYDTINY